LKKTVFAYDPIMQMEGQVHLGIYTPGTFIDNKDYQVFVGGCGVGSRKTLAEAEALLLERAISYCTRTINEAEAKALHYRLARGRLTGGGLTGKRTEMRPLSPGSPCRDGGN
jgi:hypothetical protein